MQATPAQEDSSSGSSGLVHASELMNSSSGTEVGPEVEEEVEYIEEVVEYEDEEEIEEEEKDEQQEQGKQEEASTSAEAKATSEDQPSSPTPEINDDESAEGPSIPPSSSAQELPMQSSEPASVSAAEATDSADELPPTTPSTSSGAAPGSNRPAGSAGVDLDFKQLEAQAAKVAKEMSQVALDVSSKLTAGLRSAFGGTSSGGASSDPAAGASTTGGGGGLSLPLAGVGNAGASLTKLAGGLTSWWGSLDPAPQPVRDETAERVAASNRASGELQQLFGLSPEENLVEHFKCKLLQTYSCSHNPHTPAIQMAFQGTLYVTDRHTCFCVEERGRKVPFKFPHGQVAKATRQRPTRKGDLSDVLKLELSNGQWLAFKDFDSGSALDSALALVEHLMEGS